MVSELEGMAFHQITFGQLLLFKTFIFEFKDYVFGSSEQAASDLSIANSSQPPAQEAPKAPAQPSAKSYPAHSFLQ